MNNGGSSSDTLKLPILLWGLGILLYFLISPAPSFLLVMIGRKLLVVGAGAVIVGGAAALGARLAGTLVPDADRPERMIFGAGLGLGIVSVLVLLLAHINTDLLLLVFAACGLLFLIFRKELLVSLRPPDDGF